MNLGSRAASPGRGHGESRKGIVWINGRFLTQQTTGVQRVAHELVAAIDRLLERGALDPEHYDFVVLAPQDAGDAPGLRRIELRRVGRLRGHAWEQLELPWYARTGLLLNPGNVAPILKRRQVVIVHDAAVMAAPGAYSWRFRAWYRVLFVALRRRVCAVVAPSRFSRRELVRMAKFPAERVHVVHWGAEHITRVHADRSVLSRYGLEDRDFVLAVGSLNPNKNVAAIGRALQSSPSDAPLLVLAGGVNPRVFSRAEAPAGGGVVHVGFPTDAELKALYAAARAFVFPSLYEGFGLPPLEAMACGCAVIASDIPAVREVCGDSALYFPPSSSRALREALLTVSTDDELVSRLEAAGRQRAAGFSWETAAREVLALIERCASATGRGGGPPASC